MESEIEAMDRRGSADNVRGGQGIVVRFRMDDGTEICQDTFAPSITVASLKRRLLAEWPQDREVKPKSVDDIKLLIERKVLEDSETLSESTRSNLTDDVVTVLAMVMNARGKIQEAKGPQVGHRRGNVSPAPGERMVKLMFRIDAGIYICEGTYPLWTTVAALKQMLLAAWPQEGGFIPKPGNELRLLFDGRILDSRQTLAQCIPRSRLGDGASRIFTIIVLVLEGREVFAEGLAERPTSHQCCMVL